MKMSSAQIRRAFLDYFAQQGHTIVPSSSLVPARDPTLLFTNAGMVQFKDLFLGLEQREYTRATSAQKCMRVSGKHNDLENVGPSPRHHTFFEMLGNFSFGDYFKREAIGYAWEFLTQVLGLPRERLWITIYQEDEEAFELWQEVAGIPASRIVRMGKKDNFWAMGDTGPCGPCSEIIYDRGPEHCTCGLPHCSPAVECERWWELWNLVFMQFNLNPDGAMTPLPKPSIDTGMGLERITAVMQGVDSNYDTDLFRPLMQRTRELLGDDLEAMQRKLVSYRVIADHSRAIAFLIADGVVPGNEGRNYVLRLILRRAARHGKLIGFRGPFLAPIADKVIELMGEHYAELTRRRDFILKVITQEEERFQETLDTGLALLERLMSDLRARGEKVIPGSEAFRLYDTYGFPLDLTRDVAREQGFTIDEEGFQRAMQEQRERARAAQPSAVLEDIQLHQRLLSKLVEEGKLPPTGVKHLYEEALEVETEVVAILKEGKTTNTAVEGDEVQVVLGATPFYVESGGQVSDTGFITCYSAEEEGEARWEIEVSDVRQPVPGLILHVGRVTLGTPRTGDRVWAAVDYERRMDIARNHTATHILHSELRYILGEHVQQAGSLVAPDRLRFDFTHPAMLTQDELDAVEQSVNEAILANYPVEVVHTTYDEAIASGAIALFGEKYGHEVRVVKIGPPGEPFSQELCGGTHVAWTSEIGFFHILSESGVGTGIRRIEAVTGHTARRLIQERLRLLESTATFLGCAPEEVDRRVLALLNQTQQQEKEISRLRRELARRDFQMLLTQVQEVEGVKVVAARVETGSMEILREMSDWFRDQLGSCVVVLATLIGGKPNFVAAITPDLVKRGFHAGHLVRAVAQMVGGSGGGKPTLAQAGGRDTNMLNEALRLVPKLVAETVARAKS